MFFRLVNCTACLCNNGPETCNKLHQGGNIQLLPAPCFQSMKTMQHQAEKYTQTYEMIEIG